MAFRLPASHSPAWVMAESAVAAVFSLVSMLVIGRVIGPHEAGIGAVAVSAFLLADIAGAALFPDALVQRPRLTGRHARSAVTVSVLAGLGAALVLAGAGPLIGATSGQMAVPLLLFALAPLLPLSAFAGAAAGLATREQRFRLLALRVLLGQPLGLVAGLVAAAQGFGAWAMVINQAVVTGFVFLLFLLEGRTPLRPLLDRAALAELWPVALPQLASLVLMIGRYRIFLIAVGFMVAEAALAQAHFAFRMLDAVLVMVWQSVTRIALPRLCAAQADRHSLAEIHGQMTQLQALLGLSLSIGVALVAEDLVAALLGPEWAGTADAARIAGLCAAATFLHGNHFSLFVAVGKAHRNFQLAAAQLALPLAALLLFRPESAAGVAASWGASGVLMAPIMFALVLRELGRSSLWLLRQSLPAVVGSLAMVPTVLAVQAVMLQAAPMLRLLAASAAGGIAFLAVAWLALGARPPVALRAWRATPVAAA